jgi:hypothetical protein
VSVTKRESSELRKEIHFVFSGFALSKIFARSRGSGICVKLSIPNISGADEETKGACAAAATWAMCSSSSTSCGDLVELSGHQLVDRGDAGVDGLRDALLDLHARVQQLFHEVLEEQGPALLGRVVARLDPGGDEIVQDRGPVLLDQLVDGDRLLLLRHGYSCPPLGAPPCGP